MLPLPYQRLLDTGWDLSLTSSWLLGQLWDQSSPSCSSTFCRDDSGLYSLTLRSLEWVCTNKFLPPSFLRRQPNASFYPPDCICYHNFKVNVQALLYFLMICITAFGRFPPEPLQRLWHILAVYFCMSLCTQTSRFYARQNLCAKRLSNPTQCHHSKYNWKP